MANNQPTQITNQANQPPPKSGTTLDDVLARLAVLEEENAALKAKAESGGLPLTAEQIAALQADAQVAGLPGNQVRPQVGILHKVTGQPVFNGNRPTGRNG
jgi:cell pole-organizing protein PopZ